METNRINLDNLPDDCLLYIINLLDSTSRYLLSQTCKRFENLVDLPKFWRIIDARQPPYHLDKTNYCIDRITNDTYEFYMKHIDNDKSLLPDDFFTKIQLHNLRILTIENQTIDCPSTMKQLTINDFPKSLEELSLKRTKLPVSKKFFTQSNEHMNQLRVLILDECHWVESSMFISFAKYKNLEILSVYKCCQIDDSIAYISLAGLGFNKLKIFDGRLTRLGNTLISTFSNSKSILAIYLQNQNVSYKLDYYRRQYELFKNGENIYNTDINNEFCLNDQLIDEFNNNDDDNSPVTDAGLFPYQECVGSDRFELPKSVLYKDPYGECNCGYNDTEKQTHNQMDDSDSDDDDDDDNDNDDDLNRIFLKKIKKLSHLVQINGINRRQSTTLYNQNYPKYTDFDMNPLRNVRVIRISFDNNNAPYFADSDNEDDGGLPSRKRQKIEQSPVNGVQVNISIPTNNARVVDRENPGPSRPLRHQNYPLVRLVDIAGNREKKSIPIKRLSLRGNQGITNLSLICLKELNLELLDLTYTKVTLKGIQRFLQSNPNCRIIHKNYCQCLINLHF